MQYIKQILSNVDQGLRAIWPDEPKPEAQTKPPNWQLFVLTLLGGLALGYLTRGSPLLGYDWLTQFHENKLTDVLYPPWTSVILWPLAILPWRLGLALVNGISVTTVALMTFHQGSDRWRILAALLSVFTMQMFISLWLGHIDALSLFGVWLLPWAVPLVLMKGTFIGFIVFTRRSWFLAAVLFAILSLIIWPVWPAKLMGTLDFRYTHPIAAGWNTFGWLSVPAGIILFLFSKRSDAFQAMAAGSFLYPFVLPYHFLILLPALGALKGRRLFIAWLSSWAMIIPVGAYAHFYLYFLFPFVIWWFRHTDFQSGERWVDLLRLLGRRFGRVPA